MSQHFDVLIVGGGIVGLTAALAMAQRNYTVAVIDAGALKVSDSGIDSRVYAVNKASQTLLLELGAWQHLDFTRVSPYSKMHVWDGANGASIDFDSRTIAAPSLGAIIEESVLKQALLQQIVTESSINLFPHCLVNDVDSSESGVQISSQNGIWNGQLLMIADGANSPTRHKLKVDLTTWPYHQKALVATVKTEKPHQQTACQVFNADGPLAFLPLSDPHQCSIVWSTDPKRVQRLVALDEEGFNRELTKAFGEYLGQATLLSARHQFPLQMRHVKHYIGNRWLLLGDAAHTIHPLAGLGLNVGLADVRCWLQLLDASNGILPSRKILSAYQRERKAAVWQIILLMEGFKVLFGYSWTPIAAFRGFGLRICNGITPLKRLFIQHASG
ncbi:2-polyprenyl-6-methoxyphenol 4-hydroxylase [Legionella antarctica]|uniref:2-polyprenyl-6-methoxyphenol 4-hydroxylase n=1 Tax=Legionella antarctica TaxID=2708020 RepID=A0A6F8T053_9GAMM|nr:FAD-dependent oxidoreductase [Legionella antarctica]BCA93828.1 2-polyprenyl-6-methoxyphenol 4-hydroxylase [Legionella antarctica]